MKSLYMLATVIVLAASLVGCSSNASSSGSTATGTMAPPASSMTPAEQQAAFQKMQTLKQTIASKQTGPAPGAPAN